MAFTTFHRFSALAFERWANVVDDDTSWQAVPAEPAAASAAPREWVFWAFLMCMAIAALPLVGMRWTTPPPLAESAALEDALLLALPVMIPLPFLFLECLAELALRPAARTVAAFGAVGVGLAMGLAALLALVV
jgi:hypothetical protein